MKDQVNSPKHYCLTLPDGHEFEVIHVLQAALSIDEFWGFLKGNILKYQMRAGRKDITVQDYKKAQYYLNALIGILESVTDTQG